MSNVWKKYKHIENGKLHVFESPDETVSRCGLDDLTPGNFWNTVDISSFRELEKYQCKKCVALLTNPDIFAASRRTRLPGGGTIHP